MGEGGTGGGAIPTVLSVFQFHIHHIWEEEEKERKVLNNRS